MFRNLHIRVIRSVFSNILFILTASFMACSILAYYYDEPIKPFIFSSSITLLTAIVLRPYSNHGSDETNIDRRDAYLTVTLAWIFMSLFGTLPYLLSGSIPAFTNAFFESVSGFSTTGSSILMDIEALPHSILFWRSLTHWIGGIGIIVLVIIVMPALKMGGYQLFSLESSLQEKISPKIKSVGLRLLMIYVGLTIAEVMLLWLGHMSLFESVCHAFGTVATGGFSPKNTSIANYSPYIQYVIMGFMLLAGTNFGIHYHIFKRQLKSIRKNEELRFYYWIIFVLGIILSSVLLVNTHKSIEESFREAFFQVISIVTCTGFASADYLQWPIYGWTLIFLAMFLGGSTGSTAGGIKMVRHLILLKNLKRTFRQSASPNAVIPITLNGNHFSEENNNSVLTFMMVYFLIFLIGSLLMYLTGLDAATSTSSVATCMAGIGPGIGSVGPVSNFAHLTDFGKFVLTAMMILGRLEIYTVLLLFSGNFWRD
ncbi:Trk-type K transport system, membrane component [Bacteroidales bacterium 6E]|nr:Trk-type K transport system, membrane component [Bacteroidales bacterium 6E]